jgi:hypothetical protein
MTSAFIGLAQVIDFVRMEAPKNDIFDCVGFFCHCNSFFAFPHHTGVGGTRSAYENRNHAAA